MKHLKRLKETLSKKTIKLYFYTCEQKINSLKCNVNGAEGHHVKKNPKSKKAF